MVVSFKVSKTGTRFRPKPKPIPIPLQPSQDNQSQSDVVKAGENIDRTLSSSEKLSAIGKEASFTLNLYPDGYSIGKPCKYDAANQSLPKSLLPYDRSSEALFSAIESGHLPGDILDDIPAKYVDGALICEVRDYRRCSSKKRAGIVSVESSPTVNKVCLKMSLENIVKDIPSFTDKSWTYGDIMEVESNIVKALQPNLHLDPTPKLDRLCENRLPTKLNLQRKRLRNIPEFAVASSNNIHGIKVYIDRVQENTKSRLNDSRITTSNAIVKQTLKNLAVQNLNPSIAKRSKKNIPSLTDKSQTYGDTLEVESKIPKALQPNLHLGPTPKLDRLCESRLPTQLNFQRKRLRIIPELAVTSSNKIPGKKECIDGVHENSDSRFGESRITTSNAIVKQTLENPVMQNLNPSIAMGSKNIVPYSSIPGVSMMSHQSKYPMVVGTPRSLQEHGSISGIKSSGASAVQYAMHSYADNPNASVSLHVKRESPDRQSSRLPNIAKRMRSASTGVDAMQQIGSHGDALQGSDMNWQDRLLQQQAIARGIQYIGGGIQKFPQQVFDGGLNQETGAIQFSSGQQGMRLVDKVDQFEMERKDGARINRIKSEFEMYARNLWLQQRMPQHASMRPNFPQKEAKKEDQLQKRKQIQSPRLSSGTLPHSLLSSKSGEFSNGSVGPSFGPSSVNNASGALQKEKAAMASRTAAVGTPSLTYIANDSTQRQQQAHLAAKRGSNSFPKTPSMSGVASPDSVFTDVLFNANSPSVGTSAFSKQGLQNMFERFSKIDMVTTRYTAYILKQHLNSILFFVSHVYDFH
ncbi:hypothetical protein MtrunA17_Chr5g0396871 [Medicago truncatula]|uniref:Spt20-like SEP domain-containing protein n=1 Tax=Medicago truncatula TaxID=3880 RepID=A0A396HQB0_MEDTR|nr:hypothetical protein MtrunA17_Chr5g0396871 [Medicago truncatula]